MAAILAGRTTTLPDVSAWTEIGDRVFVRRYAFYDQNIGVVLGDEAALLIDTRISHRQAAEIQADLRELTALPVGVVVNTHGHSDHAFGNHAFRPATIWGHERCVTMIETTGERQRQWLIASLPELAHELTRSSSIRPIGRSSTPPRSRSSRRPERRAALPRPRPHRQ